MFILRRRKSLFISFIILASFILFCTWLLEFKYQNYYYQKFENDETNNKQNEFAEGKAKLINDNKRAAFHDRVLLLANTLTAEIKDTLEGHDEIDFKFSRLNNQLLNVNSEKKFQNANTELGNILKYLHHLGAYIVDISLLTVIDKLRSESKIDEFNVDFNYLKSVISDNNDSSSKLKLTFGIFPKDLPNILDKTEILKQNYDLNCLMRQSNGFLIEKYVLTTIYLNCEHVNIQLSVFYDRNYYLWIGQSENNHDMTNAEDESIPQWYGDTPRAMQRFNLTLMSIKTTDYLLVPSNINKFLFDYNVSKFLECNRTMALNLQNLNDKYRQDLIKNKMLLPVITHIMSTLEGLSKHYWLAGGTLLGWYRDCGIIPHTQDVDFAVWAHEYDGRIKKAFLGNKIVRVWGTLGLVNDSYEFRMYNDKFTFDMFLVYKHNDTDQWCGYQVNKVKFRRWLPNFSDLCSCELLGYKFMVPCDPVSYLNKEYGTQQRWSVPQATNYTWSNVNHWKSWSDAEWPHVIKYYDKEGKIIDTKILQYLNKHSKYNITKVPDDS